MKKILLALFVILFVSSCDLFDQGKGRAKSTGTWKAGDESPTPAPAPAGIICGTQTCTTGQSCLIVVGLQGCYTTSDACGATCNLAQNYCLLIEGTPTCISNGTGTGTCSGVGCAEVTFIGEVQVGFDLHASFPTSSDTGTLLNYGATFVTDASECKSGKEMHELPNNTLTGKCGCSRAYDDPCDNGKICKVFAPHDTCAFPTHGSGNGWFGGQNIMTGKWGSSSFNLITKSGYDNNNLTIADIEPSPFGFSDIKLIMGSQENSCHSGYVKLLLDLNKKAYPGSSGSPYIFLCVKYASKAEALAGNAIEDIRFNKQPNPMATCQYPAPGTGGYQIITNFSSLPINVNAKNGNPLKECIYGYYKKGLNVITMITAAADASSSNASEKCRTWDDLNIGDSTLVKDPSDNVIDLNAGAGGDYIYVCYKKTNPL